MAKYNLNSTLTTTNNNDYIINSKSGTSRFSTGLDVYGATNLKGAGTIVTPNANASATELVNAEWVLSKVPSKASSWYGVYKASEYATFTALIQKILDDGVHTAYVTWDANYTASTTATILNTAKLQRLIIDNVSVTMNETIRNVLNIGTTYTSIDTLKTNLFDRPIDIVVKGNISLDIFNYGGVVNLISGRPFSTFYGKLTCYNPVAKPDNPYNSWNYFLQVSRDASGGAYGLFHIIADSYNFTVKSNWLGFYKFSSSIEAGTSASRYYTGALTYAGGNVSFGTQYKTGSVSTSSPYMLADDNTMYGDNWLYAVTLDGVVNYGPIITIAGDSNMRFFRNISGSAIRLRPRGGSRVYFPYGSTTYNGFSLDQAADAPSDLGNFIVNS